MKMAEKSANMAVLSPAFQKDCGGVVGGPDAGAEAAPRNRVDAVVAPAVAVAGCKIGGGVAVGHEGGEEEDSASVVVGNGQKAPSGGRDGDCGDVSLLDKGRQRGSEEDEDIDDDDDCGSEKMMVEEEDDGDSTRKFLRGDGDCGGGGALDAAASEGLGDEEAAGQGKLAEEESLDKDADLSQLGDDTAEAFEEPSGGRGRKADDVISEEEEDDDVDEDNSTSNPIENPKDANTNPHKDSTASLSELGPKTTISRNNADIIAKSCEQDEDEKPTTKSEENSSSSEETAAAHAKKKPEEASSRQLYGEIQENFVARDKLLGEIAELSSNGEGASGMDSQIEQTMSEIRTLNELAVEKEREWNNIIYFKKMKEELLLRMQRRKRVLFLEHASNSNSNSNQSLLAAKKAGGKSGGGKGHLHHHHHHHHHHKNNGKQPSGIGVGGLVLNQNQQFRLDLNGIGVQQQTKQRPLLDVQSIIADYRQRHPETVPRRGRRIRNAHSSQEAGKGGGAGNGGGGSILNFSSLALGSGAQVHHNVPNVEMDADIDGNQTENSRPSSAESATQENLEPSLKDMLAHIAKLEGSTSGGGEGGVGAIIKPPPPYPEVTVHPVPPTTSTPMPATNSLLHGILTKGPMKANTKTSFSPTLARLLTTPERGGGGGGGAGHGMTPTATVAPSVVMNSFGNANVSISEILSTNKARSEITITPVETQYEPPAKRKYVTPATQEEDEADAADRLVIDESNDIEGRGGSGGGGSGGGGKSYAAASMEDNGDEVPQCQGCNQKSALFVCAGCGNQWYCSRECQVSAWDEHSEVCSG